MYRRAKHLSRTYITSHDDTCICYHELERVSLSSCVVPNIYHEQLSHRHEHEHVSSYDLSYALSYGPHVLGMGWPRLVGSLKLQVSFAEYSLFYRALLQKRPIILRSLLIVATPYDCTNTRGSTHMYDYENMCLSAENAGPFCKRALKKRRYSAKRDL